MIKKTDIFLAVSIILITLIISTLIYNNKSYGDQVFISKNGEVIYNYPLSSNKTIKIENGKNILKIEDGYAYMVSATCPDLICVSQEKISKKGESIVCLPHGIIVEIK
ncbi:MAG: NusG domain II-containing protein [bacterium]|nr:NusG domain II-containing protein [bacterium]